MTIEIELIEKPSFTIKIGTVELAGFHQVSTWNGYRELVNAKGEKVIIAADTSEFTAMFSSIFQIKNHKAGILSASPNLIDALQAARGGSKV